MPLTRDQKEAIVADMAGRLKDADVVVVTDYRGLDVAEMTDLRARLREDGSEMRVVKNTLMKRALADAGLEGLDDLLEGPTAVALLYEELAGPTKTLKGVAKDTERLEIKGGLMDGRFVDRYAVEALADLPTKDELFGSLLGVLQAPRRQLVTVIGAPLRDLVGVLNARAAQSEAA